MKHVVGGVAYYVAVVAAVALCYRPCYLALSAFDVGLCMGEE